VGQEGHDGPDVLSSRILTVCFRFPFSRYQMGQEGHVGPDRRSSRTQSSPPRCRFRPTCARRSRSLTFLFVSLLFSRHQMGQASHDGPDRRAQEPNLLRHAAALGQRAPGARPARKQRAAEQVGRLPGRGRGGADDMLTPTGYPPPPPTQQPARPIAHTAHSQHCRHTALPPG